MPARAHRVAALLVAGVLLTGCTLFEDPPQESTGIEEPADTGTTPAPPTPAATPTPGPTPEASAAPTPPTGDGIIDVVSRLVGSPVGPTPLPTPATPSVEATPTPVTVAAPAPAPPPEPAPLPPAEPVPPPSLVPATYAEPTPTAPPTPAPPPAPTPATTPEPTPTPPPTASPPPEPTPTPPPSPTPSPPPPPAPLAWPREGSHLTIEGRATDSAPDTYANASTWRATWTYRNGDWHGTCQGSYAHDWADAYNEAGSPDTQGTFTATFEATDPPHWPLFNTRDPPAVGEEMTVWLMWDCDIRSTTMVYSGVEEGYHTADDTQVAEENYSDFDTQWDADSGLVWSWDWSRLHSSTHGRIVSTDHP